MPVRDYMGVPGHIPAHGIAPFELRGLLRLMTHSTYVPATGTQTRLRRAVDRLIQRYVDDVSVADLAQAAGISTTTIRNDLYFAQAEFRRFLAWLQMFERYKRTLPIPLPTAVPVLLHAERLDPRMYVAEPGPVKATWVLACYEWENVSGTRFRVTRTAHGHSYTSVRETREAYEAGDFHPAYVVNVRRFSAPDVVQAHHHALQEDARKAEKKVKARAKRAARAAAKAAEQAAAHQAPGGWLRG